MKAAIFRGIRDIAVEDVAPPVVAPDGVVIEVKVCGICGTDLHIYTSGMLVEPGQIMGHEFSGEIVAVGDRVDGIAIGDRVTAMPLVPCGSCAACRSGEIELCATAYDPGVAFGFPGAFSEQVHIPEAELGFTVFKLDDGMSYEAGALAEPLAVAVHAVERRTTRESDVVVVVGLGPIGQLVARVLKAKGAARVIGVEVSEFRLAAAERAGLETVRAASPGLDDVRAALGPDTGVDAVFECSGIPALAQAAMELVRKGGDLVIVATYEGPAPVDVSTSAMRQVTVYGSSASRSQDFVEALRLLGARAIDADQIVTAKADLDGLPDAFERLLADRNSVKTLTYI